MSHSRGGSRIFFRSGCTRLLLYFSTNKPHSFFFWRIPVVLENRRSSQGGVCTPCTLPLDPPLHSQATCVACVAGEIKGDLLVRVFWRRSRDNIGAGHKTQRAIPPATQVKAAQAVI